MSEWWKDYIRGFDVEGKEWLKTQYVKNRSELLNDPSLKFEERQFLLAEQSRCMTFLRQEMTREGVKQ